VNAGGDPQASVYRLVSSTLRLQGIEPTLTTQAYTGQSLLIQVRFVDGTEPQHPKAKQAQVTAHITMVMNGISTPLGGVILTQNQSGDDVFSGYIKIPANTFGHKPGESLGTIQIKIDGTYLDATRTAVFPGVSRDTISISLLVPIAQQLPPRKCTLPAWQCFVQEHQTQILILVPLALLLLLLLIFWLVCARQPVPKGRLSDVPIADTNRRRPRGQSYQGYDNDDNHFMVVLGTHRTLFKRMCQKSVISSEEIRRHPDANGNFNPLPAKFELVATCKKCTQGKQRKCANVLDNDKVKNCQNLVHIREAKGNMADFTIKTTTGIVSVGNNCVPLESGDIIRVDGNDVALYQQ
jgi:hypothetical protein